MADMIEENQFDVFDENSSLDFTEKGVNGVIFHISNENIEKSTKFESMSKTLQYYTEREENGSITFKGYVSEYNYKNGKTDLDYREFGLWLDTVYHYIDQHNKNLEADDLHFEITNIDNRAGCQFTEYKNGQVIREGIGWCKDLETNTEKKAWRKAVKQYKKDNGINTPTDTIKSLIERAKEKINNMDICSAELDLTPPMAIPAMAKISTNPCEFIPSVKKAFGDIMESIASLPNPKALANYYVNLMKHNVRETLKCSANIGKTIIAPTANEMFDDVDDSLDYYEQLDSEREEWLKTHPEDMVLLDTCKSEELQPQLSESYYSGNEIEWSGETGGSYSNEGIMSSLSSVEAKINADVFKKLRKGNGFSSGDLLSQYVIETPKIPLGGRRICGDIKQGHIDAIHQIKGWENFYIDIKNPSKTILPSGAINCFVTELQQQRYVKFLFDFLLPIRIAWEEYCTKNGWDSTWTVTCTYRNPLFNASISSGRSGSVNSAHLDGLAMDVQTTLGEKWTNENKKIGANKLLDFILAYCNKAYQADKNTIFRFDQCFREESSDGNSLGSSWVHCGWRKSSRFNNPEGYFTHNYYQLAKSPHLAESGPLWKK